ncbi:uncharacterized protein LOC128228015 [Mya arenaria]|uniref:uncharacterized protein LOC128228015 n=1 Tax=Mya arenaria TaxID=6604 RepID=UPI0022E015DB|nr:uncharacterized protein LOC128228015 [Mya arenaria]
MIYLNDTQLCSRLFYVLSVLYVLNMDLKEVNGLRCWKCIAHDCDLDPEDNYKATKVDCKGGNQQCMKVQYRMFDNVTHYDSVIRTCTDRPCHVTRMDEFFKCIGTPKQYMISGCTLPNFTGKENGVTARQRFLSSVTYAYTWSETLSMCISVSGLPGLKCIAHDCDLDPEDNYKATKVDCKGGNKQCMVPVPNKQP